MTALHVFNPVSRFSFRVSSTRMHDQLPGKFITLSFSPFIGGLCSVTKILIVIIFTLP